jgi:hypothetical protein
MYLYYCKDANCRGHAKSWERCCDMRAFAATAGTLRPAQAPRAPMPDAAPRATGNTLNSYGPAGA